VTFKTVPSRMRLTSGALACAWLRTRAETSVTMICGSSVEFGKSILGGVLLVEVVGLVVFLSGAVLLSEVLSLAFL
jgi:hypothetical protein